MSVRLGWMLALVFAAVAMPAPLWGQSGSADAPPAGGPVASSSGAATNPPASELERTESNFLLLDRDQDGVIELDEDFAHAEALKAQFGTQLEAMDLDEDGRITRDEFFGRATQGGRWHFYAGALLAVIAFGALCLTVDAVLDKDHRGNLLLALAALVAASGLAWLCVAETFRQLMPLLVGASAITLSTLIVAVVLGKPVEEEPIETFVPAGAGQKRYVIGSGGRSTGTASRPAPRRPARPQRRPRRPPPAR